MSIESRDIAIETGDGHRYSLVARVPPDARRSLLWLPALGISAKHYVPLAEAFAARGVAVFVHEWRGNGSSGIRASQAHDWGYRELLLHDVPASVSRMRDALPDVPRVIGGHSLGGQLACCTVGLDPTAADAIWLAGSGAPYWRTFPQPQRLWLPLAYRFLPWLAHRCGYLPGRRVGFGGNEARSLIRDWATTAISGRYAATGIEADLEAGMATLQLPVRAALFAQDWLAPEPSLRFLASKLPRSHTHVEIFDAQRLGTRADHYAWMKRPQAVAAWFDDDA